MTSIPLPSQRRIVSSRWAFALCTLWLSLVTPSALKAAFGLTTDATFYTVDTDAGLVFKIRRFDNGSSTQSPGDIASLVYNGVEYQDQSRGSQINSGFDWLYTGISASNVTAETVGTDYVKVTVTAGDLTHYYIARRGDTNIYMGTYFTTQPDVHGLVRYIMRMPSNLIPDGPVPSDIRNTAGAIESGDIFGLANGETRSKHYSNHRQMDWTYVGASGPNVGVWMVKGNEEGMSGGPFYRSLIAQTGSDQEVYAMINYGEGQTDVFRPGILNLYTFVVNNGSAPVTPDLSWMGDLNLLGWVPVSARGAVAGTTSGIPATSQTVVGFSNATAQYWAVSTGGTYTCTGMIPGTYTATLYKGELAVAAGSVTVTAGTTATLDLVSTEVVGSAIFRIGEWDGAPNGFLNADKFTWMHPSDVRMDSWAPAPFLANYDPVGKFPSIEARAANSPVTVQFYLAPNQITDLTLKIGITTAYNGGRPQVNVNNAYNTPIINPSNQPQTRTFTVGTYRGNNTTFTFTIPASALVVGLNTMKITPLSGSADATTWLSAGWVYDAVELDGPIATPAINYVGGNPLVISGTAEPRRSITVTLDGTTVIGTTTTDGSGSWTLVSSTSLASGNHSVSAVADDGAGHASPTSAAAAFNAGIAMPVIASAQGDTGTYASGATTSDRVFVFNGSAGAGNTVTLTRLGTGTVGSTVANASGAWSFDYTSVSLPDGANRFYATASNGAGNSASSPVFTLNLAGAPRVAIARFNPATNVISTGVTSVVFRVTFNHNVSNVSPGAFALGTSGTATGTIASVSASAGSEFDVTVNALSGTGNLRLDLKPNVVLDGASNPEAGFTAGESYSLVLPTTGNGTWVQPASGGLWSDALNWQNAVIADGTANSANFSTLDIATDTTVHLDSPRSLNSATFADTAASSPASWTVDNNGNPANRITLGGASPTITVGTLGTGAVMNLGAGLAGTSGLAKAGVGTLVLSGPSTLTGALNVNGGNVQVANGASLALGNSAVNVGTNCTLEVAGGSFSAGGLVSAAQTVLVSGGTATLGSFRTNSNFGAILKVTGGTLNLGDVNLQRTAGTAADFNSGFIVSGGSATVTTLRVGTLNSYSNVSVEGTGTLTATGTVTLGVQTSGARGGALRVLGNGTFNANDTAYGLLLCRTTGGNTANVGAATFTGGVSTVEKITLGFDNTVTGGSGTITVNGGALYIGSGGIVKNGTSGMATTLSFSSGTVGAKANWSTTHPVTLPTNGNVAFKAADAAGNPWSISLNGVVSGAGGFTKTGGGTLTLDGGATTHTYTGATTVNAGTLRVTSTLATAANGIAVNAGGTLGGNGIVNRAIALNNGGVVAPDGASAIATLTGTTLSWNGGGTLACDLGANGSSDVIALTGAFAKGSAGTYNVAFAPGAGFAAGNTYTLVTFASTTFADANAFSATGLPDGIGALFQLKDNRLQVRIQAKPNVTSATPPNGMYGAPYSYTATADDTPATFSVDALPPGLTLDPVSGVISGTPTAAGIYPVTLTVTNTAGSTSLPFSLTIAKAPASIALGNLAGTYTGTPHGVSALTSPIGLPVTVSYNGSAALPVNAGSYAVEAVIADPNYAGVANASLVIAKAEATVTVTPYAVTYDTAAHTATGTATGVLGETLAGLNLGGTTHTNAGTYHDTWTFTDITGNYLAANGAVTDTIDVASATIALDGLNAFYDGTPKAVTTTTTPAGLTVDVTYDGVTTAPTMPGTYAVVATINDSNYSGTASGTLNIRTTALVRHAPALHGEIDGSVQVLSAQNMMLNGSDLVSGDLLVPGSPAVRLNGAATLGGTQDSDGAQTPANYTVTLNGAAMLRYLVRRVDAIAMPTATAAQAATGTRDVTLLTATDNPGDVATIRNLTVAGSAGDVALPAGTYGQLTVTGGNALVLGHAGAAAPDVYYVRGLTVNTGAVKLAGPVVLVVATNATLNDGSQAGAAAHPEWLSVELPNGGVTLNGSVAVYGHVLAPNGTVTLNGDASLRGSVASDRLTLNGAATLATAP